MAEKLMTKDERDELRGELENKLSRLRLHGFLLLVIFGATSGLLPTTFVPPLMQHIRSGSVLPLGDWVALLAPVMVCYLLWIVAFGFLLWVYQMIGRLNERIRQLDATPSSTDT